MTNLVKVIYKGNEMVSGLKGDNGKDGKDGAEFRFVTQSEYDALTEEEKMNGITYAIYGTTQGGDEAVEAWKRFINREPLSGGEGYTSQTTTTVPDGAKMFFLSGHDNYSSAIGYHTALVPIKYCLGKTVVAGAREYKTMATFSGNSVTISMYSDSKFDFYFF